jgi:hypothetical protein
LDENAHKALHTTQLLDTNGRGTTTTMHSHVRRNAYVYTTADLAMTVLDCDETTSSKVPLAPDNHSGSGTAADCIKETNPIPIEAGVNKLGLDDSPQRGVSAQSVKRFRLETSRFAGKKWDVAEKWTN